MSLPFSELARVSSAVAEAGGRNDKVTLLAELLRKAPDDDIVAVVAFLTGSTPWGRIGIGWAVLNEARAVPAAEPTLTVAEVTATIAELTTLRGEGSTAARRERLIGLFAAATAAEQRLLAAVFGGQLRQGAQAGVMTAAIAAAASVRVTSVRRAAMMAGDLAVAALAALTGGAAALDAISLVPLRPIQPMLASPGADIAEAIGDRGPQVVEVKLDGARIQAHRAGDEVRLYTRNLNDVTARLPGVVQLVESFPGGDLVLDGEVLGLADDESPRRFQDTMGDLGADGGSGRGADLRAFFFDLLLIDGEPIHDVPFETRRTLLGNVVPEASRPASIVTADVGEACAFFDRVIAAGHEGVVVKDLDHLYEAGRRGAAWRKVKPVHTLDLVVIGVEWGHGRRTGMLSNLHLAALPTDDSPDLVMVGKTFKGMTDEMLAWQTARFSELETGSDGLVVRVEPVQVVEVAVDGVQPSTRYPGGLALRFARVRRYRHDKSAAEADTIDTVRALL